MSFIYNIYDNVGMWSNIYIQYLNYLLSSSNLIVGTFGHRKKEGDRETVPLRPVVRYFRLEDSVHLSPIYEMLCRNEIETLYVSTIEAGDQLCQGFEPQDLEEVLNLYEHYLKKNIEISFLYTTDYNNLEEVGIEDLWELYRKHRRCPNFMLFISPEEYNVIPIIPYIIY